MAVSKKVLNFLEKNKIKYEIINHRTVYTAFDKAQTLKVLENIIGKTLIVKFNGDYAMVLIPANKILDKEKFKKIVKVWRKKLEKKPPKTIGFVTETWMKKRLLGVKVGAIPPFGNLWGLPTFVDELLFKNPKIIVSGGDYNVSIKISINFFKKLIPDLVIGNFNAKKK